MFESEDAFSKLLKKKRVFFGGWIGGGGTGLYTYPEEKSYDNKKPYGT